MAFVMDAPEHNSTSSDTDVDYTARNEIEAQVKAATILAAGTQDKTRSIVGYISGYIDLGCQPRGEFEDVYKQGDVDQEKKLADGKNEDGTTKPGGSFLDERYNNDAGGRVMCVCTPRKPADAFVLTVDFPQIIVDKGSFYGDSKPLPLRMYLGGGEFWVKNPDSDKKMPIVQAPLFKSQSPKNPHNEWAFGLTTTVHKMAAAAEVLNEKGLFKDTDIPKLFGKPLLFQMRIWDKPNKNDPTKTWYTESIKFVSQVPEGVALTPWDEKLFFGINFKTKNSPENLQMARNYIWNTTKLATNWEGSALKESIDNKEHRKPRAETDTPQPSVQVPVAKEVPAGLPSTNPESAHHVPASDVPSAEAEMDEMFDGDIPF